VKAIIKAGAIIIAVSVGAAAWCFRDAMPLRGALTEGSRFNVSIGSAYDDARRTLESQSYNLFSSEAGGLCVFKRFDETRTVNYFSAPGWPPGTVCIVERGGQVSDIVWAFELSDGFL